MTSVCPRTRRNQWKASSIRAQEEEEISFVAQYWSLHNQGFCYSFGLVLWTDDDDFNSRNLLTVSATRGSAVKRVVYRCATKGVGLCNKVAQFQSLHVIQQELMQFMLLVCVATTEARFGENTSPPAEFLLILLHKGLLRVRHRRSRRGRGHWWAWPHYLPLEVLIKLCASRGRLLCTTFKTCKEETAVNLQQPATFSWSMCLKCALKHI